MKKNRLSQLSDTEKLELIQHLQAQVQALETIYPGPCRLNLDSDSVVDDVIKHLPILIFTVDTQQHIVEIHGQAITQLMTEDAIPAATGQAIDTVFQHMPAVSYDVGRALQGKAIQNTVDYNGAVFRAYYQPIQQENKITGLVVVLTDLQSMVEREKTYLDTETRLRAIFEQTQQFMCLLNADGKIVEVNRVALDFADIKRSAALGQYLVEMSWWDEEAAAQLKHSIEQCLQGEKLTYETRMRGTDRQVVTIDLTLKPIPGSKDAIALIMAEGHNVTERKMAEAQIRTSLEREKELSELKSNFIKFTSHEFRNPLAVIASSAYILERHTHKLSDEMRAKHFEKIHSNVDYIATMLDDILLLGRLRALQMGREAATYPVSRLIATLLQDYERRFGSTHTFTLKSNPEDIHIYADQTLLEQAINQVLKNAVTYTGKQGHVEMDLTLGDGDFTIRIRDDGVGILPAERQRIFDSFVRGSNVEDFPGTGLGLAIVKDIVDLHEGTITVESESGQTEFIITIPQTSE